MGFSEGVEGRESVASWFSCALVASNTQHNTRWETWYPFSARMQAASCDRWLGSRTILSFNYDQVTRFSSLSSTSWSAKLCPLQNRKKPNPTTKWIKTHRKLKLAVSCADMVEVQGWFCDQETARQTEMVRQEEKNLNYCLCVTQLALGECCKKNMVAPYLLIALFLYPLFLDCSFSITLMGSHTLERTYHLKTGSLGLEILTRKMLLSLYQTCSSGTTARTFVMSRTHLTLLSNQEKSELELWRKVFIHSIWFFFLLTCFFPRPPLHSFSKSLLLGVGE